MYVSTASRVPARNAGVLAYVTEEVLLRSPDGSYWSAIPACGPQLEDIRSQFESVSLVCRVRDANAEKPLGLVAIPDGVSVVALPFYKGVGAFIRALPALLRAIWRASGLVSISLLRLPGAIGSIYGLCSMVRGRKFATQLIGDPDDVLGSEGFRFHERLFRLPAVLLTRFLCRHAVACAYVTNRKLQQRYPPRQGVPTAGFSDVILELTDFQEESRSRAGDPVRLVFCGSLAVGYKGLDVLLDALARLVAEGRRVTLDVIGEGILRRRYEHLAAIRNVEQVVRFHGQIARSRVVEIYRRSDIFVMPSLTEGLPRAMIEAMAQGLPCVGSAVGGIPELLDDDVMVPPGNSAALAARLGKIIDDKSFFAAQGRQNLERARAYGVGEISLVRSKFWADVSAVALSS